MTIMKNNYFLVNFSDNVQLYMGYVQLYMGYVQLYMGYVQLYMGYDLVVNMYFLS